MSKKTITILALHLNYGGVEKFISSLCKMLEDNYQITIISTYNNNYKTAFEFSDKIKIKYLINGMPNREELKKAIKNKKLFSFIKESFKAAKILFLKRYKNIMAIKSIKDDYIITTRIFHNKLVSRYAKKGIIKISTEHNFHNNDLKYVTRLIKSIKNYDYFVAVSNELKEYYEKRIDGAKVVCIPNVIDEMPKVRSNLDKNNLISVGRLSSEKGFLDLIDVFNGVHNIFNDSKLYIIGDGVEKPKIISKIEEYGLEKSIILTGFLSKKEIEKYMLQSKIYVMTSYTESFGLVLIEAMSYGVPCIAYDSASGAKEIIKNDKNGILVGNRDSKLMTAKITSLMKNKKKLKEYSEEAYKASKKYLINNVKKEWLDLLN